VTVTVKRGLELTTLCSVRNALTTRPPRHVIH
jgi:hypothetical protein